jgi:hypothetical protein
MGIKLDIVDVAGPSEQVFQRIAPFRGVALLYFRSHCSKLVQNATKMGMSGA